MKVMEAASSRQAQPNCLHTLVIVGKFCLCPTSSTPFDSVMSMQYYSVAKERRRCPIQGKAGELVGWSPRISVHVWKLSASSTIVIPDHLYIHRYSIVALLAHSCCIGGASVLCLCTSLQTAFAAAHANMPLYCALVMYHWQLRNGENGCRYAQHMPTCHCIVPLHFATTAFAASGQHDLDGLGALHHRRQELVDLHSTSTKVSFLDILTATADRAQHIV
jgi:hypothetical protein